MEKNNEIEIMESIFDKNEKIAQGINHMLTKKNIFAINVMGAPGVGKTTCLINIISKLSSKSYVIEGDIESDIDAKKLKALNIDTIQINTGGACHLDSPLIVDALSKLDLKEGVLFIENIGNLVCPAEFLIGEHIKMLISSVTEGSDKPYKYPLAFEKAHIILINKEDLMEHVDFELEMFKAGVKKLNKDVKIFLVSGKSGYGYDEVINWIEKKKEEVLRESISKE